MEVIELNGFEGSGYLATNESTEVHEKLIAGCPRAIRGFQTAAAIASGGEVILHNILPRTTGEVIAVDHSLSAILSSYLRFRILEKAGSAAAFKSYFEIANEKALIAEVKEQIEKLPAILKTHAEKRLNSSYFTYLAVVAAGEGRINFECIPNSTLNTSLKRLKNVTFIHGDFRDLKSLGKKFDFLYLSNALGHAPRESASGNYSALEKLDTTPFLEILNNPGFILATNGVRPEKWNWTPIRGTRTVDYIGGAQKGSWKHYLWERDPAYTPAQATA